MAQIQKIKSASIVDKALVLTLDNDEVASLELWADDKELARDHHRILSRLSHDNNQFKLDMAQVDKSWLVGAAVPEGTYGWLRSAGCVKHNGPKIDKLAEAIAQKAIELNALIGDAYHAKLRVDVEVIFTHELGVNRWGRPMVTVDIFQGVGSTHVQGA